MIGKKYVSQEIHPLSEFHNLCFSWMKSYPQLGYEKFFNRLNVFLKHLFALTENHKIICISRIIPDFKLVLDKLIELIEVYICKYL